MHCLRDDRSRRVEAPRKFIERPCHRSVSWICGIHVRDKRSCVDEPGIRYRQLRARIASRQVTCFARDRRSRPFTCPARADTGRTVNARSSASRMIADTLVPCRRAASISAFWSWSSSRIVTVPAMTDSVIRMSYMRQTKRSHRPLFRILYCSTSSTPPVGLACPSSSGSISSEGVCSMRRAGGSKPSASAMSSIFGRSPRSFRPKRIRNSFVVA